jgi:hypothetical protein
VGVHQRETGQQFSAACLVDFVEWQLRKITPQRRAQGVTRSPRLAGGHHLALEFLQDPVQGVGMLMPSCSAMLEALAAACRARTAVS